MDRVTVRMPAGMIRRLNHTVAADHYDDRSEAIRDAVREKFLTVEPASTIETLVESVDDDKLAEELADRVIELQMNQRLRADGGEH